jgi:hypothetical protein
MPMFPGDPGGDDSPRDRLLFHVLDMQAQSVKVMAALLQDALDGRLARNGRVDVAREKRPHRPVNERHRTYASFRAAMCELEDAVGDVKHKTKVVVCALGPDSVKTVTRTMVECYGLRPQQWPPSTWPAEPPNGTGHV